MQTPRNNKKTHENQAANYVFVALVTLLCLIQSRGVLAGPGAVVVPPRGVSTEASLDHEAPVRRDGSLIPRGGGASLVRTTKLTLTVFSLSFSTFFHN